MARGFGLTNGVGNSDIVTVPFSAHSTLRSYACWIYRTSTSNGQRIFNKQNVAFSEILSWNSSTSKWTFFRNWTPSAGTWNFTGGTSTNTWYQFTLTYDAGSASNNPVVCIDGALQTTTRTSTPSGTVGTDAGSYNLGNRADGFANLDGRIAEFAIWDRILSDSEIGALCKGARPSFFMRSLKSYVPLIRSTADMKNGASTVTGGAVKPHPKAFGPALAFANELPPPLRVAVPALVMSGGPLGVVLPREVHAPRVASGNAANAAHPGLNLPATVGAMASEVAAPTAFLYELDPPALVQAGGPVLPALDRLVTPEIVENASTLGATQPGRTLGLAAQAQASSMTAPDHFLFKLGPPPLVQAGGPLLPALPRIVFVEQLGESYVAEGALVESTIGASALALSSGLFAVDAMPLLLKPSALVQAGGPALPALVRAVLAGRLAQASSVDEAVVRASIGPTLLLCHSAMAQPGTRRKVTPVVLAMASTAPVARPLYLLFVGAQSMGSVAVELDARLRLAPPSLAQHTTLPAFGFVFPIQVGRLSSGSTLGVVVVYGQAHGPTRLLLLSPGSARLVVTADNKRLKVL